MELEQLRAQVAHVKELYENATETAERERLSRILDNLKKQLKFAEEFNGGCDSCAI